MLSPMAIQKIRFNTARTNLANAGSHSAQLCHPQHGAGSCPDDYGKSLLRGARDDFRTSDAGQANLRADMTQAHYNAVHAAATLMGINQW